MLFLNYTSWNLGFSMRILSVDEMTFPSMFLMWVSNLLCLPRYFYFFASLSSGWMKMLVPLFFRILFFVFFWLIIWIIGAYPFSSSSSISLHVRMALSSFFSSSLIFLISVSYTLYSKIVSPRMVTLLFRSPLMAEQSLDFRSIKRRFIKLMDASSSSSSSSEDSELSLALPCLIRRCSI
jgi:hypothetical protein